MNYIGSKWSLLSFLEKSILEIADKDCRSFCDLFAGTGAVGKHFKEKGFEITANDMQYYSFILNRHYIGNTGMLAFENLRELLPEIPTFNIDKRALFICNYLTSIPPVEGFIYNNYCLGGTRGEDAERLYFTDENGKQCDAIRIKIEDWYKENLISENEYFFLLATLIENIDKLANTASVYGAYLKKIKKSAAGKLQMNPAVQISGNPHQQVFCEDANTLISKIKGDILYLDPPYNHRQYAANYHLLETIAKYDAPALKGKTGLRNYSEQKSDYCMKSKVSASFEALIQQADFKYIFLSYNNEGLMSLDEVKKIMSQRGEYGLFTKEYSRFKADKTENRQHKANSTFEYLHYVKIKD
jgi:adenine-specific DNA-methyltransferase